MIADLKPYPTYKESGSAWLGKIPAHWTERRSKYFFREVDERSVTGEEELLSVSHLTGVTPRSQKTVTMFLAESTVGHKLCRAGDVVVNTMWAWMAAIGIAKREGLVSPSYGVYRPRPPVAFMPEFVDNLLRTPSYVSEYTCRSTGVTNSRLRLYPEQFLRIPLMCPPFDEQRLIQRFVAAIDRQTQRYIRAKQRLTKLLEEQQQAVIHRAVTRGIDRGVRLKPSGVEWLGEVPEHWEVRTLGGVATSFRTGPFGSILHQSDYIEGGTPLVNPTHMRRGRVREDSRCSVHPSVAGRLSNYMLEKNDLIFARRGALGRCALVRDRETGWLCGTGSIRVRVAYEGIEPEYLIEALQVPWVGEYLSLSSVGATMDSLNTGILKGVPVLVPPIDEQRALLAWIAEEVSCIAGALGNAEHQISALREYRTRLIADVVTGKLDVRKAAALLPEEGVDVDVTADAEEGQADDLDAAPEEAET